MYRMPADVDFYGADLAWLRTHRIELQNCLSAISLGQSYTVNGRAITRANYDQIRSALGAVAAEITRQEAILAGTTQTNSRSVFPRFC